MSTDEETERGSALLDWIPREGDAVSFEANPRHSFDAKQAAETSARHEATQRIPATLDEMVFGRLEDEMSSRLMAEIYRVDPNAPPYVPPTPEELEAIRLRNERAHEEYVTSVLARCPEGVTRDDVEWACKLPLDEGSYEEGPEGDPPVEAAVIVRDHRLAVRP